MDEKQAKRIRDALVKALRDLREKHDNPQFPFPPNEECARCGEVTHIDRVFHRFGVGVPICRECTEKE